MKPYASRMDIRWDWNTCPCCRRRPSKRAQRKAMRQAAKRTIREEAKP